MIWPEALIAFVIALVVAALLISVAGYRWPVGTAAWPGAMFVFLLLFLGVWAAGVWMDGVGPQLWGVFWVPFIATGVLLGLMILALAPEAEPPSTAAELPAGEPGTPTGKTVGLLFWIVLLLLASLVLAAYWF